MGMVKENRKLRTGIRGLTTAQFSQECKWIKQSRRYPKAWKVHIRKIHMPTYTLHAIQQKFPKYQAIAGQVTSIIFRCYHHKLDSVFKSMLRTFNQNALGLIPSRCLLKNKHPYLVRSVVVDIYMSKNNLKNLLYLPYDIHTPLSYARCSKGFNLLNPGY